MAFDKLELTMKVAVAISVFSGVLVYAVVGVKFKDLQTPLLE
jgi:hypothetical protein